MRFHFTAIAAVSFCLAAGFCSVAAGQTTTDSNEISNAQIRDVIARVARHQIHLLADGDYPAATNLDAAEAAKSPTGIAWNYPWGVALFGMERVSETTGDSADHNFVVEHNLICARYYHWLAGLENQFGEDGKTYARGTAIKGLMTLGNLDSCGSMGNQMLESMIRSPDKVSPEEQEVVERIANWVIHKQDRLPDGTLWRSA